MDSLIPIKEACDCLAMKRISLILRSRSLIFKCKICKLFFWIVVFLVGVRTIAFGRHIWSITTMKWDRICKGTFLLFTVFGPGLTFLSPKSNKISLKNESYYVDKYLLEQSWKFDILENNFEWYPVYIQEIHWKKWDSDAVIRNNCFFGCITLLDNWIRKIINKKWCRI